MNGYESAVQQRQPGGLITGAALTQGTIGAANAIQKPSLQHHLDQLAKVLSGCHEIASSIENTADRVLGAVPQAEAPAPAAPRPETFESRLSDTVQYAERLVRRLHDVSQRLNSAV